MRESTSPDDPRTRRSRESLLAAVRQVAQDGPLTISAVSSAAGVTRATFYNHFVGLEEAAWLAMLDSFEKLLDEDVAARRAGSSSDLVGADSLRRVVELLREDSELVRIADGHRTESGLPGLAHIVLGTVRRFRAEFGPKSEHADAEDTYVAAGLYAVLAMGARGDDARDIAAVAYSLLPTWMKEPSSESI